MELLNKNHVKYQREYSFNDLRGSHNVPLRFDFCIFRNNKILALLEWDGEQHFKYTKYFHKTKLDFMRQKEWDRRKNSYCLMHNIPLIRIPFWDLDNITFSAIFNNDKYLVKSKYHNDYLMKEVIK